MIRFGDYTIEEPIASGGMGEFSPTVEGEEYNLTIERISEISMIPDSVISNSIARLDDIPEITPHDWNTLENKPFEMDEIRELWYEGSGQAAETLLPRAYPDVPDSLYALMGKNLLVTFNGVEYRTTCTMEDGGIFTIQFADGYKLYEVATDMVAILELKEFGEPYDIKIEIINTKIPDDVISENIARTTYVDNQVAALVNAAPETLDTLGELATAFEENKEVVEALDASITNKQDKVSDTLILVDTVTGTQHKIQIQNGQLVSFPVE